MLGLLAVVSREARMGQNEAWFRELNERLEQRALERRDSQVLFRIVCECDREVCTEQIEITIGDYEAARRSSTAFIIVPGHADLSFERIISIRAERYEIVEKLGDAALVAEAEDPRG